MRIEPDLAQALADFRVVEIRQGDAVRDGIGEAFVLAAGAGELGVEVDGVANVTDDQERRAALLGRQGGDVAACLVEGAFKGFVEGDGAALAVAGLAVARGGRVVRFAGDVGALLAFPDERAAPVKVDEAGGSRAVGIPAGDGPLKDVSVLGIVGRGWIGARQVEKGAKLAQEAGVIGPLGSPGVFPAFDEGGDLFGGGVGHGREWFHSGRLSSCRRKRGLIPTDSREEASALAEIRRWWRTLFVGCGLH